MQQAHEQGMQKQNNTQEKTYHWPFGPFGNQRVFGKSFLVSMAHNMGHLGMHLSAYPLAYPNVTGSHFTNFTTQQVFNKKNKIRALFNLVVIEPEMSEKFGVSKG